MAKAPTAPAGTCRGPGRGPGTDSTFAGPCNSSQSSADSISSATAKFPFGLFQSDAEAPVPTSFLSFIFAEQKANTCSSDLAELINSIQAATKTVNAELRSGGLSGNNKRKVQEKVEDILTNFIHTSNPATCMLLTPNRQFPIRFDNNKRAKYAVCLQPLEGVFDGTHTPLFAGTVFGVHKVGDSSRSSKEGKVLLRSPLLPGRHLVAAGYALYGITTTFVLSLGRKSNIFVLDPTTGEFMLNNQPLTVPNKGQVYNVNEGHIYEWNPAIVDYIENKKDSKYAKAYRSEHFGCVIADVHFTLLQGGICMLPKIRSQSAAQFSVLLCLAPLAYVACSAGGLASNGEVAILDICPESITQTTPAFIGSREDVRELITCLSRRKSSLTKAQDVRASVLSAKLSTVACPVQPAVKNESKLPTSDSSTRSHSWRPSMDTSVNETKLPISDSPTRSHSWRPSMDTSVNETKLPTSDSPTRINSKQRPSMDNSVNESKLPPSDSPARSHVWRPLKDSSAQPSTNNELTSDSRTRNHTWRPTAEGDKDQTVPTGRSHLTIPPSSPSGSGVTNKIKQTSAVAATIEANPLAPVAPLTIVKNDRIRLTWPAFGSIMSKSSQQSRKL